MALGDDPNKGMDDFSSFLREQGVPEEYYDDVTPSIPTEPEPAQAETPEPDEPPPPAAEGERARDEKGRFKKSDEEVFRDRFGEDPEKLVSSYREAEAKLTQLFQERADDKRRIEELERRMAEPTQPQWDVPSYSAWERQLEENPAAAAHIAVQRGDMNAYQQALQVWGEQDPFNAAKYDNTLMRQLEQQQLESRLRQEFETRVAPLDTMQVEKAQNAVGNAYARVAARHPDISEFAEAMAAVAQTRPALVQALEAGTVEAAEQVWEDLYVRAKWDTDRGRANVRAREAEHEDQAKQAAFVASGNYSPPRENPNRDEQLVDRIVAAKAYPSIQEQLNPRK